MNPDKLAVQYLGKTVDQVFEQPRLLVHAEPVEGVGTIQLWATQPAAGVGGKQPRWRFEIRCLDSDGKDQLINDGKAHAPWFELHYVMLEALRVMAVYVDEARKQSVTARRDGMGVV